ncbi:Rho GTPase-activating protein 26 [Fasciola gigantica]|uniref:Rho GTPase-activating protein 26 n=1 Tax=Fasciola gigantica TaxID=46835 RepID=A0A504ZF07_FASGI|nr:Rho GTPase-activating protein 26 [Fasciola gigantica]
MTQLRPLEFRDCVVDGPHFRSALHIHQKELKKFSKRVKEVYATAERVFKTMDQLQSAVSDFAVALSRCYIERDYLDEAETPEQDTVSLHSTHNSFGGETGDFAETDDERVIRTAFVEFSKIIHNVEEARKTMLAPIRQTMLAEIDELRSVWLSGSRTDPKLFLKDTSTFCTKLEKYLAIKQREQSSEISLFMQMLANFYHQAYEQFQDSHHQRNLINQATQRVSLFHALSTIEPTFHVTVLHPVLPSLEAYLVRRNHPNRDHRVKHFADIGHPRCVCLCV